MLGVILQVIAFSTSVGIAYMVSKQNKFEIENGIDKENIISRAFKWADLK